MNVKERLKEYIKYKNLTVISFERSINRSNGYVSSISKSIQPETILAISEKYPDLSIEWLLIGKGRMIKQYNVYISRENSIHGATRAQKTPNKRSHYLRINTAYTPQNSNEIETLLKQRISDLEKTILDKDRIISLLEMRIIKK
ncbi:MAG: hypothetical protein U0L53_04695 [Bacteroidales bacterium]|nr:hypothetical protein [Bacteroidales bacterium]